MRKSRLSEAKQQRLIELFIAGATARTAAALVGVHRNTAAFYFHRLRQLIGQAVEDETGILGAIGIDGTGFGAGRKGRSFSGAPGEVAVFGILKGCKKVYTAVVPEDRFEALVQVMREKTIVGSIVYTDCLDRGLALGEFKNVRGGLSSLYADESQHHLKRLEDFWEQAKDYLIHFYGIPREHLGLFLKEWEWRYNHPEPEVQSALMKKIVKDKMAGLQSSKPVKRDVENGELRIEVSAEKSSRKKKAESSKVISIDRYRQSQD